MEEEFYGMVAYLYDEGWEDGVRGNHPFSVTSFRNTEEHEIYLSGYFDAQESIR